MKKFTFLLIILSGSISFFAQDPGDLFTDFGTDGIIKEDWPDTTTIAYDIVLLPDNNLAVPFTINDVIHGSDKVSVIKLDLNGEITNFGGSSRGFIHDFSDFEMAMCAYALPDGKILAAGTYGSIMSAYPFVLRLNSDGQIDEAFGDHGIYTDLDYDFMITCMDVYWEDDSYMIILSGLNIVHNMMLIALDADGNVVSSFGESGTIDLGYIDGHVSDMEIDPETGSLFVCSYMNSGGTKIMKLNLPDGSYNEDFGTDGVLSYTPAEGFNGDGHAIVYKEENNTLAIFGSYPHPAGDIDIFAYRVNADDGSPDAAFGIDGWSTLRSAVSTDEINTAILQSDGRYYFGGNSDFIGTTDFFIGRINDNGGPDATFGTNGLMLLDQPDEEEVYKLALNTNETFLYAIGNITGMNSAVMISAHYTGYEHEVPVSVSKNEDEPVLIYPNPVKGLLHIATNFNGRHRYELTNLAGAKVASGSFNEGSFEIDLTALPASAYILSVTLPDSRLKTFKILKKD